MALIDTYKNTMNKKRNEMVNLNQNLAKEQSKIAALQKKISDARSMIKRTKNESTIKSKIREIQNFEKSSMESQKRCSDIQEKIAQAEKKYAEAERKYVNEESKNAKKKDALEKQQQKEINKQKDDFTKSLHQYEETQVQMKAEIDKLKALPNKITVLFLAANPVKTVRIALDEEARAIQHKIQESEYRDAISLETRWAVRSSDILQAINETNPTIIHFSGHGTKTGEIVLLNPDGTPMQVSKEAITMSISTASDTVRLVVFNACFTAVQASNVVEYIDAAIGMSDSVQDNAACLFAAQLYSSIGFGLSLKKSFDQAKTALMLENIQGEDIPELYVKLGIDPDNIIFVGNSCVE